MVKDSQNNKINRNQSDKTPSEHGYTTTASPRYPNIDKAQENDIKSCLIKMIEAFKDEINKSLF